MASGVGNGPGGLKVGDLYVAVTASIGEAVKNLADLADAVEEAADDLEGHLSKASAALGDMAEGFLSVAGLAAGAFVAGAQSSQPMKDALDELTGTLRTLSVEVGSIFTPLVKEMTEAVKYAVAYWRNLDSGLKAAIVSTVRTAAVFGVLTVGISRSLIFVKSFAEATVVAVRTLRFLGTTAVATGPLFTGLSAAIQRVGWALVYLRQATVADVMAKLAASAAAMKASLLGIPGTLSTVGASFSGLLPKVAAIGLPVLAVAAAVAGLVLLAGSLYKNWDDLVYLVRESTSGLVDSLAAMGQTAARFFSGLWTGLKGFILAGVTLLLDNVAKRIGAFARFLAPVTDALKMRDTTKALREVQNLTGKQLADGLLSGATLAGETILDFAKSSAQALADQTKGLREGVAYGLKNSIQGAKELGQDLSKSLGLDGLEGKLSSLLDRLTGAAPTQAQVDAVGTTDTLDEVEKQGEKLKEAIQKISGDLFEAARVTGKWQAETAKMMREGLESVRDVVGNLVASAVESYESAAEGRQFADAVRSARDNLKSAVVDRLGEVTSLLNTAMQGFSAGGVWGALIAVVVELLTRSEGFASLIEMTNEMLSILSDSLGSFFVPQQALIGAVGMIVDVVGRMLAPVLTYFGEMLAESTPVLATVGILLEGLMPLFTMLTEVLKAFYSPVSLLMNVGLRGLFEVVKWLGAGLMLVVRGLAWVWNGVLDATGEILRSLASALRKIPLVGAAIFDGLTGLASDLADKKFNLGELSDAVDRMTDLTWEQAQAAAESAAANLKNASAVQAATEALTNVPSGWKIALARFDAQNGRAPMLPASGQSASPTPAPSPTQPAAASAAPAIAIDSITINARDPAEALNELDRKLGDLEYRSRGTRARRGRYGFAEG